MEIKKDIGAEIIEKIKILQKEIERLVNENKKLKKELLEKNERKELTYSHND